MGNSRSFKNKKNKADQKEKRLTHKQEQQLSFSLVAAREINEQLTKDKEKLRSDLARMSRLLTAAALEYDGLRISAKSLDAIYTEEPTIAGFYVRKPVDDGDGVEIVVREVFEEDLVQDPSEDDEEEDEDFLDNFIPEVEGEQADDQH